jgi:hypothetical protein
VGLDWIIQSWAWDEIGRRWVIPTGEWVVVIEYDTFECVGVDAFECVGVDTFECVGVDTFECVGVDSFECVGVGVDEV